MCTNRCDYKKNRGTTENSNNYFFVIYKNYI